jgi:hypothetical protein
MRTLTNKECRKWVESQGLSYEPYHKHLPWDKQFNIKDAEDGGAAAQRAVLAVCRQASQVLAVIVPHALTSDDRRDALAALRTQHGEERSLEEAPGHLLKKQDGELLEALVRLCIGPGAWSSVYFYLAPIESTLYVWESSLIDVWSERHADIQLLKAELPETGNE